MRKIDYKAKVCGNTIYTYSFYSNIDVKTYTLANEIAPLILDEWDVPASRSSEYFKKMSLYRKYVSDCDKKSSLDYDNYLSLGLDDSISRALGNAFYRFGPELYGLYNINDSALSRSRRRLKDLIYCNYTPETQCRFLTLTYKNAQFSPFQLKQHFKTFIKRLKYHTKNNNIRYIAVPEKHQSVDTAPDRFGSYHMHVLLFDTGYIDSWELADIWGHGTIDIIFCYGDANGVAHYLSKYLVKDMSIDYGRRFLASESCIKPTITSDFSTLPMLQEVHSSVYTDFSGAPLVFTVNKPYNIC